jgi:hypothetical protein
MPSISITPQSQNYGMYGVPSMPYNNWWFNKYFLLIIN